MKKSYLNSERNSAISLKPSMTIRLLLMVLFVCLFGSINNVSAAIRTASVNGNWNAAATWGGSTVPTNADDVTINTGVTVTVTANTAFAKTLTINPGGVLNVGGFSITVSGITSISGTLNHTANGNTKTYTGLVTINSGGIWNNSGNSTIIFKGGLTNSGTFTAGTGLYTFNTTSQALAGTIVIPKVTVTGVTLTNNGTLTVATALAGTGTFTNSGTLATGGTAGTITVTTLNNSGTINHTGTGNISTVVANFKNTGTLNLNGSGAITGITNNAAGIVNIASSGTITSFNNATATSTLNISALTVPTITNLTVSTAGNTVNYNGLGNQTIKVVSYSNLTLSGSGTKTLAGNTTVNKDITINSGVTLDIIDKDLTINGNIIINGTCTSSDNNSGKINWNNIGTLDGVGTFSNIDELDTKGPTGSNKTILATANITFTNASIDGDGNTITNEGVVNISGTLGFKDEAQTNIIWVNVGTLNYASPTFWATLTATDSNNTVNYTGAAQTIKATTYNNLTLSGSGIKTFEAATTIKNTLSIETGVVANLGTFTHTAEILLSIGGEDAATGSWGSTSSAADNKDDNYFAVTSGTINYSCSAPTITAQPVALTICENTGDTFTITSSGASFQWQYSVNNGSSWTNTSSLAGFSGHTTAILTLAAIPLAYNGYSVRCVVRSSGGCRINSNAVKLTVNAKPATPTFTVQPGATAYTNTDVTYTTQSGQSNYIWGISGTLNTDYSITSGGIGTLSNTVTLKWLTTGDKTVTVNYSNAGGCSAAAAASTMTTVSSAVVLTAPTATITQPVCSLRTGTITFTSPTPANVIKYTVTGTNPPVAATENTTGVFAGLAAGIYTYSYTNALGTSSASVEIIAFVELENKWNGSVWSTGLAPTAEQKIIFDGNYSQNNDIVGCSCQVNDGKLVTIVAGRTLTLTNELKVIAPLGTLAFEDGASLVQINNVATNNNTGDIQYYRSTYSRKTDYNYLSSPVSPSLGALGPQTLGEIATDLSDGTFYSYKPTETGEDWEPESAGTIMVVGKGYIATRSSEIPQSNATIPQLELQFSGIPNNGHYEITPIYADKSYLLGNPYPSALDADTFLNENKDVLNGTLYFWTHNTAMKDRALLSANSAGSGAYAYTTDDYATYNATGGVAATNIDTGALTGSASSGNGSNIGTNNNQAPSGKIASGQGFFASTKTGLTDTKIVFDNTMRVGVIDIAKEDNTQFFKTRNPNGKTAKTKAIEKNRIWLNMTNSEGAFKQTLVGYLTDATNDYDDRFDGESFDGNEFIDFYSLNQDLNLTIQGRALPFDEKDEVPLGYRTTIDGAFTINIAQADGLLTNQAVFIEDKLTNTLTDLKKGNYTFNTAAGTFNERFVLKYSNKTLSVDATDKEDGILAFYSNNYKTLIIRNNLMDATVNSVALFNMLGQNIDNWDVSESEQTNVQVPIKNITSGIYIVKVKTTKGESSKKIIVN